MTLLSLLKEFYQVIKNLSFSFSIIAYMTAISTSKQFSLQTF